LTIELTSEELREKRRAERKQFKVDRANAIAAAAAEAEAIYETEGRVVAPVVSGPGIPSAATWRPSQSSSSQKAPQKAETETETIDEDEVLEEEIEDIEHLQLTLQEAFFLIWTLDCLTITDPETVRLAVINRRST
jgi:tRNA-splicing endonuclease subunit Sen2